MVWYKVQVDLTIAQYNLVLILSIPLKHHQAATTPPSKLSSRHDNRKLVYSFFNPKHEIIGNSLHYFFLYEIKLVKLTSPPQLIQVNDSYFYSYTLFLISTYMLRDDQISMICKITHSILDRQVLDQTLSNFKGLSTFSVLWNNPCLSNFHLHLDS